jgi:hypothetical protein
MKRALVRLLWNSIADGAVCSCEGDDRCPECEAMQALGFARWVSALDTRRCLANEARAIAKLKEKLT